MAAAVRRAGLNLLMVLYQELACLELVRVHGIQQLPPGSVRWLQILPVKLLCHHNICQPGFDASTLHSSRDALTEIICKAACLHPQ